MDWTTLGRTALHWLWPQTCAHCREDLDRDQVSPLCLACQRELTVLQPPFCPGCAEPLPESMLHCRRCARETPACRPIRAVFLYRGSAVSLIHAFKYSGRRSAARVCGYWMAAALARHPELPRPNCLVPIPLHPAREKQRGYNQARLLCEGMAARTGIPMKEPLVRRKKTKPQWDLSRDARLQNLQGAFAVRDAATVKGRRILLIDDICTSGASLEACARSLKEAGAAWVGGYAFAREALRGGEATS